MSRLSILALVGFFSASAQAAQWSTIDLVSHSGVGDYFCQYQTERTFSQFPDFELFREFPPRSGEWIKSSPALVGSVKPEANGSYTLKVSFRKEQVSAPDSRTPCPDETVRLLIR